MNPPKCDDLDYIQFLIAAQTVFSSVEAAKTHPADHDDAPAHDAYTRLLQRLPSDSQALWDEVASLVNPNGGVLVVDDTTLDKPYASKMELVTKHWSGKHRQVVQGINLISLVWSDETCRLPYDFRIYNKDDDGLTKNDHFRAMLTQAAERGLAPDLVAFDSWYSGLDNLKHLRDLDWDWLTRLKANRKVSIDHSGNRADILIPPQGRRVHLRGYGWVKVFRTVGRNGDAQYWATNRLDMTLEQVAFHELDAWQIEVYHRDLKQFAGIEDGQYRLEVSQRNHIGCAIRAFVRLEVHRIRTGISFFQAEASIIRSAIRSYLADPDFTLPSTA